MFEPLTDESPYVWEGNPFDAPGSKRWICAIMKVSPQSISFWDEHAAKYGEEVMYRINFAEMFGKRALDVLLLTNRPVADVVLSAWNEYNTHVKE